MEPVFRSQAFRRRFHRGVKYEQNRFENKSRFINFTKLFWDRGMSADGSGNDE